MCSLPIPSGKRKRISDCFPPEAHAASRALFRGGSPTDPQGRSLPPKGAGGGKAAAGCRPENPLRCSENLYHKGHCVFIIDDVRKGIGTAVLAVDGPANGMT